MFFFPPDGGFRPVATEHPSTVRKRIEHFTNTPEQDGCIATWQVRPSNRLPEQDIAGNHKTLFCGVETDASGGMTRSKQHIHTIGAQANPVTWGEVPYFPLPCV